MVKNKFNEKISGELVKYRKMGLPLYVCADKVGINVKTLYRWLKDGENPKNRKHGFYLDMNKARQEYLKHKLEMEIHINVIKKFR